MCQTLCYNLSNMVQVYTGMQNGDAISLQIMIRQKGGICHINSFVVNNSVGQTSIILVTNPPLR